MRLFTALILPDPAIAALETLQSATPRGRAVPPENLHLTLSFLGDVTPDEAEAAHEALEPLRAPPIVIALSGVAVFGGRRGQAVGLEASGQGLADLQSRGEARLRGAGLRFERRRFRPHVTLVRMTGGADASPVIHSLTGARVAAFRCVSFGLFRSHLFEDGAQYDMLAQYPLGAFTTP